jgi:hypothetical protein
MSLALFAVGPRPMCERDRSFEIAKACSRRSWVDSNIKPETIATSMRNTDEALAAGGALG